MEDQIVIRKADQSDTKKLSILYKTVYIQTYGKDGVSDEFANFITSQFSIERLANIVHNDSGDIIVAEYKGNLVGVAEVAFDKKCPTGNITSPELNKLYVLDWFCGKGIGQKLMLEVEKAVSEKNISEIWLWVLTTNHRAVSFYEKQNYKTIGTAFFQMETNKYENKVMVKRLEQKGRQNQQRICALIEDAFPVRFLANNFRFAL